jgi:SpoVK/Ycf46/Vps4 family AAA+-type ATPase
VRKQVIAATNRIDILDPALLRSGRLDRKIEFPLPNEEARARIIQIHSRKMTVGPDVNFQELARCCDEFNAAQCKAICVEAGMIALRRGAVELRHEDFMEGMLIAVGGWLLRLNHNYALRNSRGASKEKDYFAVLCIKLKQNCAQRTIRAIKMCLSLPYGST